MPRGAQPLPSHSTVCRLPSRPRTLPLFLFFQASMRSRCAALNCTCCSRRAASSASLAWVAQVGHGNEGLS
jgi:hypothetical protein